MSLKTRMLEDRDLCHWGFADARGVRSPGRVIVDPHGELPALALALRARLALLAEERLSAREYGLVNDQAYSADLEHELHDIRHAHTGAVMLRLAFLRAAADGRAQG